MKYLLGLLLALNVLDAWITESIVKNGLGKEANPFLAAMIGEPRFIIFKIAGVILCGIILWDVYRRHPRLAMVSTGIFVVGYAVIVSWNSYLLFG